MRTFVKPPQPRLSITSAQAIGTRERQEDSFVVHDVESEDRIIITLGDGLGGHLDGHFASETAVQEAARSIRLSLADDELSFKTIFRSAFIQSNRLVKRIPWAHEYGYAPATTLIAAVVYRTGELQVASIGDSLCWVFRNGQIHEILTPQGLGNVMEYAIGYDIGDPAGSAVQHTSWLMQPGDRLLVASDGLLTLSTSEIVETIEAHLDNPVTALLDAVANRADELQDNTTIILITADIALVDETV